MLRSLKKSCKTHLFSPGSGWYLSWLEIIIKMQARSRQGLKAARQKDGMSKVEPAASTHFKVLIRPTRDVAKGTFAAAETYIEGARGKDDEANSSFFPTLSAAARGELSIIVSRGVKAAVRLQLLFVVARRVISEMLFVARCEQARALLSKLQHAKLC